MYKNPQSSLDITTWRLLNREIIPPFQKEKNEKKKKITSCNDNFIFYQQVKHIR